jgi:mannose-6-phosphate isomerase-like protein (cupin superfamily)/DNA-binding XRE family transcriptional regulator
MTGVEQTPDDATAHHAQTDKTEIRHWECSRKRCAALIYTEQIISNWVNLSIYTEQNEKILRWYEQKLLAVFITTEYNRDIPFKQVEMNDSNPRHARAIGEKLREVRQERGMSLRDLATKAEVSASMLSQIETGKVFPSVRSLYSIATALGVSVDYFFPEPESGNGTAENPVAGAVGGLTASEMRDAKVKGTAGKTAEFPHSIHSSPVVHPNTRPTIELMGGVTWSRLTALAESGAEFLEIRYAPGAMSGANMSHHEGREFGFILEGELIVELGFESYALGAGDSIIFESTTPHRLINKSAKPMRAVWVVLSPR